MNGRLTLGAGMLIGLAYDNMRRAAQAEKDHPPIGRLVDLSGGARMHVVEQGSGPPVLLIHGALMQSEDMAMSLLDPLSERYRVVAVDRPGHGHSTRGTSASIAAQAAAIREAMSVIGVERPIIVGHSLGGTVALSYALQFPDEVSGLVVLSGYCYPTPRLDLMPFMLNGIPFLGQIHAHAVSATFGRMMLGTIIERIFAPDPVPNYFQNGFPGGMLLRPRQLSANGEDFSSMVAAATAMDGDYGRITAPLAILSGTEDHIVWPQYHGERLHRNVPESTLRLLPGTGHMIHHVHPGAVVEAVGEVATRADEIARQFALAG